MPLLSLEIAVQDAAGARIARDGGADRVELCTALGSTGGLTPSLGLVEAAASAGLPVQALIRCRPGPFVYDADEAAVMARDAALAVQAGAAGVVIGALTPAGTLDAEALRRIAGAARAARAEAEVTCHRAIDVLLADGPGQACAALDTLVALGATRLLSSGGAPRSLDGLPVLAALVRLAAGRVQVQAGGGVRPEDIAALAQAGVDAVHLSAKAIRRLPGASTGPGGGTDEGVETTDPALVAAAAAAVRAVHTPADAVS